MIALALIHRAVARRGPLKTMKVATSSPTPNAPFTPTTLQSRDRKEADLPQPQMLTFNEAHLPQPAPSREASGDNAAFYDAAQQWVRR